MRKDQLSSSVGRQRKVILFYYFEGEKCEWQRGKEDASGDQRKRRRFGFVSFCIVSFCCSNSCGSSRLTLGRFISLDLGAGDCWMILPVRILWQKKTIRNTEERGRIWGHTVLFKGIHLLPKDFLVGSTSYRLLQPPLAFL